MLEETKYDLLIFDTIFGSPLQILETLKKKGLKAIDAIGKEFDTDFHEAITYIKAPSKKMRGKIVDEIEKGYMLQDKVIRYTKVVIGQ